MADKKTEMAKPGLLSGDLRNLSLAWRAATLNQPLIGAVYTAAGLGALGSKFGPWLSRKFTRLFSPVMSKEDEEALNTPDELKDPEDLRSEKRTWAGVLAALGALGVIGLNWRSEQPGKGLFSYGPMDDPPKGFQRTASMPDLGGAFPLSQCLDMINNNDELQPYVKAQALNLLESFNVPPTQPISGGNLVGQAIATGQSAATGLAVGWLTAKALGLPNPKSTAILGAVANTLGPWSAVATSLAFGR